MPRTESSPDSFHDPAGKKKRMNTQSYGWENADDSFDWSDEWDWSDWSDIELRLPST